INPQPQRAAKYLFRSDILDQKPNRLLQRFPANGVDYRMDSLGFYDELFSQTGHGEPDLKMFSQPCAAIVWIWIPREFDRAV
ncbi:MAG: hypothetical protein CO167_12665, partial [Candidatus Marinimicrobia bacterium CG_4_9_14_3_um_filter_48_9]